MTYIEAMEETSKLDYGYISRELKTLIAQISMGITIVDAFKEFAKRIGTDMAEKTTTFLLSAIRHGGDLKTVFTSTAKFLNKMLEAEEKRKSELYTYLPIIYVTLAVFLITMFMLYQSLTQLFTMESEILQIAMTQEEFKILLFDLAIFEALFGGLIATKLSQGSIYPGLKHSIIMLSICIVGFIYLF
jgi:flagellar protein FlaJ